MSLEVEKDDRGYYSLCVWNVEEKSNEEIEDTFGKYGKIANIHRAHNLVFLRFLSYEDASSCLKAFQNHPVYRAKPARIKNSTSGFQRRDDIDHRQQRDDRHNQNFSNRQGRYRYSDGDRRRNSYSESELPPMPRLRPACKSPVRDSSKPRLEVAKGVMIGNLHPEIHQKDIYDLCSKTHALPLQVDMKNFKVPNYRTVYYAHVYVKTDIDVENIIKGLNKLKLNGHTLVVNSIDKMLEEARKAGISDDE